MSFFNRKKWEMHLYLNGIYVGKTKINSSEDPSENNYLVHFWFKKQIFHSNHVKSVIHPTKCIRTDEKKKRTHWVFEYEKGLDT